jgi:Tol biopolymer transport system component
VKRLLARDPEQRYQTAGAVFRDLRAIGRRQPVARKPLKWNAGGLLRPIGGMAAGLMFTIGGLVPGTIWLAAAAETAWTDATDRRTSVWVGDAGGAHMAPMLSETVNPDAFWLGNGGGVVYSTTRSRGRGAVWTAERRGVLPRVIAQQAAHASVTPNGRIVVFRKEGREAGMWRLDLETGSTGLLVQGEIAYPTVLPDGRTILFERQQNGAWSLWSMPINGGPAVRISDRAPGARPIVAPDGRRVAFETEGGVLVCSLPACSDEKLLAIGSPRAWTPDGRGLAYIGPPDGANVWVADIRTGARRQLTRFSDREVTNIAWSPDGRRLAVTRLTTLAELALLPALQQF